MKRERKERISSPSVSPSLDDSSGESIASSVINQATVRVPVKLKVLRPNRIPAEILWDNTRIIRNVTFAKSTEIPAPFTAAVDHLLHNQNHNARSPNQVINENHNARGPNQPKNNTNTNGKQRMANRCKAKC